MKTPRQIWARPAKGDVRAEIALHTHKTLVQKLRYIKEVNQWGCFMPRSARLDASGNFTGNVYLNSMPYKSNAPVELLCTIHGSTGLREQ